MPPLLTDGVVRLRPYQPDDVDALYEAVRESIAEIQPWMEWAHPAYSWEESEAWIAETDDWRDMQNFAIVNATTGAFLGGCGLNQHNRHNRFANLGYWVRTSATGRGIATRATRLLAAWALDALVRVEIVIVAENLASQRVAEKAGATREGLLYKRVMMHGRARDAVMYSMVSGS